MQRSALQKICDKIRKAFDAKDEAREKGLALSREVIRNSANAIRAVHRGEFGQAEKLLEQSARMIQQTARALKDHPGVMYAGFVQDAQKEHAEALITLALIRGEPIPDPDRIKVEYAPYLGGLAEAVGELRRHILDRVRREDSDWGEEMLAAMDDIYYQLVSFDYPAAVSGNLKRTTDVTRSILERTRGDLTNALRQHRLQRALRELDHAAGEDEEE
jgi:translin